MIADIMNVDVVTIKIEEGPALGAAILAMVGAKAYINVEEACKNIIEINEIFIPNVENTDSYMVKYNKFRNIYPTIKNLF